MSEEQDKLRIIAAGNKEAFEWLFFHYQPRLVYFLEGLTHDKELSRDMAQDLFLALWKDRQKLEKVDNFSSYLFSMARYTVYDYFDHLVVSEKYATDYLLHAPSSISEEELLFVHELQALVNKTVSLMSLQRQRVYRMSREDGLSNDEIASTLGISKRTVENHLTSALAILRKVLYSLFLFAA
ncbi:MAG: RNA polymerase sigma-70 factor [Tannerellaceae bacterium]